MSGPATKPLMECSTFWNHFSLSIVRYISVWSCVYLRVTVVRWYYSIEWSTCFSHSLNIFEVNGLFKKLKVSSYMQVCVRSCFVNQYLSHLRCALSSVSIIPCGVFPCGVSLKCGKSNFTCKTIKTDVCHITRIRIAVMFRNKIRVNTGERAIKIEKS